MDSKSRLEQVIELERLVKVLKIKVFSETTVNPVDAELTRIINHLTSFITKEEDRDEFYKKNQDGSNSLREW